MYIYPSSPESASSLQSEESAAVKIQAGFRGYRVRKQLYSLTKPNKRYSTHSRTGNRRQQHTHTHAHAHAHTHPHIHPLSHTQARTYANERETMEERSNRSVDGQQATKADVATMEDRCATKIQAGFRGFLVRKKQKIATDAAVKIQSSFRGFKARKEAEKLKHP